MRARAFHIMDPKGIIEMLLIFLEERGDSVPCPPALDSTMVSFILNFIDQWIVRNFWVSIVVFLLFSFILFLSSMVIMVIMISFISCKETQTGLYHILVTGKVAPSQNAVVLMEQQLLKLIQFHHLR
jgi:hypothetical protein